MSERFVFHYVIRTADFSDDNVTGAVIAPSLARAAAIVAEKVPERVKASRASSISISFISRLDEIA